MKERMLSAAKTKRISVRTTLMTTKKREDDEIKTKNRPTKL